MTFGKTIQSVWHALLDAVLPEECTVCGTPLVEGEEYICLGCQADMPRVDVANITDNAVHVSLATTHPIHRGASLLRYRRGSPYTNLILRAKYNGRPRMARWLGTQLAVHVARHGFFDGVEVLIPVPINAWKMMRRGYNQSWEIAKGVSKVSGVPVVDAMKARRHSTQTRKGAQGRRSNAQGVFSLKKKKRLDQYSHVALVDDVITTGSTILECARVLRRRYPHLKISVLSAALTEQ